MVTEARACREREVERLKIETVAAPIDAFFVDSIQKPAAYEKGTR